MLPTPHAPLSLATHTQSPPHTHTYDDLQVNQAKQRQMSSPWGRAKGKDADVLGQIAGVLARDNSNDIPTVVMSDQEALGSSHVVPPQPREASGNPDDGKDSARHMCAKPVLPASTLLIGQRIGAKVSETCEVFLSLILLD